MPGGIRLLIIGFYGMAIDWFGVEEKYMPGIGDPGDEYYGLRGSGTVQPRGRSDAPHPLVAKSDHVGAGPLFLKAVE